MQLEQNSAAASLTKTGHCPQKCFLQPNPFHELKLNPLQPHPLHKHHPQNRKIIPFKSLQKIELHFCDPSVDQPLQLGHKLPLEQEAVRERKEEKEMIAILESKPELLVQIDKKKEMQIITETRKASHNPM
jgi:hypothetical protein